MKKTGPLMIIDVILMIILAVVDVLGTITYIRQFKDAAGDVKSLLIMKIMLMILIFCMLIVGILYLLNNYGKKAANIYKSFLLIQFFITLLTVIPNLVFSYYNVFDISITILYSFKAFILILLTFAENLGKKKTFTLFYCLTALDAATLFIILYCTFIASFDYSLIPYIAAIIADGTLALAIYGKYIDKESRGSK